MSDQAGSYAFGDFDRNESELDRLNLQAGIAVQLERNVWKQLGVASGMNAVDCACGSGTVTFELARHVAPGKVLGLDLSEKLLEQAHAGILRTGLENLSFRPGNVYDLSSITERFDFAYARFLFQHLEKPVSAAENILSVLKPGGMFCAVDVDDQWLGCYPESGHFRAFTDLAAKGQKERGGDRFVGMKMAAYFRRAGFTEIKTTIIPVTSDEIGIQNFLDITTGFKLEQISAEDKDSARRTLDIIYAAADADDAWGAVGVFVTTGIRKAESSENGSMTESGKR